MDVLDKIPDIITSKFYTLLEVPNLKVKWPSWFQGPSPMFVFWFVMTSYMFVTAGIIYDIIVEPPSVGSSTDENGHSRPVAFMPYRVNGQYIMEGLASAVMFITGGIGFIVLEKSYNTRSKRTLLTSSGCFCVVAAFICVWIFMRMKLPGYLQF